MNKPNLLFPTPVWTTQLDNYTNVNEQMYSFIKSEQKKDKNGITKSNIKGWHSNDFNMDIKESVCSPRFHSQWLPDVIQIEPRSLSKDVINNLKIKGHQIIPYRWGYIGEANGILIMEDGFYGGGDSRGETSAIGY